MTIILATRPLVMEVEDLGDATRYVVALADMGDSIYAAVGGRYQPTAGGYFAKRILDIFQDKMIAWAHGEIDKHFADFLYQWHVWLHMWDKQGKGRHRWDFTVAMLFAWLHRLMLAEYDEAACVVGYIYNDNMEATKNMLEYTAKVLY